MHRHEEIAARLAVGDQCSDDHRTKRAFQHHEISRRKIKLHRIAGVDLDEGFADMGGEPRALSRPGHRVPMVANAPRIEGEWEGIADAIGDLACGRDEARATIRMVESAFGEEARRSTCRARGCGHWNGMSAS